MTATKYRTFRIEPLPFQVPLFIFSSGRKKTMTWKSGNVSTFLDDFLSFFHSKPGRNRKRPLETIQKIQWRRRPEIADFLPRPICRNVLEDFCCINFGGFSRGFSWRIFLGTFFPTKMRRKNPARKSAKKSSGSKIKIREKSALPKAGPKISIPCRGRTCRDT